MNAHQMEARAHEVLTGGIPTVTATSDGTGTGSIPPAASQVTVSSSSANDQITLPSNVIGHVVRLFVGATGCEMICADAAAKINDVVCGATNECALAADQHYICECISATEWIVRGFTALGADAAAIVPDAL